jgi:hypothetical protein
LDGGVAGGNGCSGEGGEKGISLFRLCFRLESDFMCLREREREREILGHRYRIQKKFHLFMEREREREREAFGYLAQDFDCSPGVWFYMPLSIKNIDLYIMRKTVNKKSVKYVFGCSKI